MRTSVAFGLPAYSPCFEIRAPAEYAA